MSRGSGTKGRLVRIGGTFQAADFGAVCAPHDSAHVATIADSVGTDTKGCGGGCATGGDTPTTLGGRAHGRLGPTSVGQVRTIGASLLNESGGCGGGAIP